MNALNRQPRHIAGVKSSRKATKRRSNKMKRLVEIAATLALEDERNRNKATTITERLAAADRRASESAVNSFAPVSAEAAIAEATELVQRLTIILATIAEHTPSPSAESFPPQSAKVSFREWDAA